MAITNQIAALQPTIISFTLNALVMRTMILLFLCAYLLLGCQPQGEQAAAYGNFESAETIVAAQANGQLLEFTPEEGLELAAEQKVGQIDTKQLELRKAQLQANMQAIVRKAPDVQAQLAYFEQQIALNQQQLRNLQQEQKRYIALVSNNAAPQKQLDDLNHQIAVVETQIKVVQEQRQAQLSALTTQKNGLLAEVAPLQKQVDLLDAQIQEASVINPVSGTVTLKMVEPREVVSYGKPLYKIANLQTLTLRAYFSGAQLSQIKLGQTVKVRIDGPEGKLLTFPGKISWIASKAEFTPKVIQTREERVNLVYAVKILVTNNGQLKLGMPAEVYL